MKTNPIHSKASEETKQVQVKFFLPHKRIVFGITRDREEVYQYPLVFLRGG